MCKPHSRIISTRSPAASLGGKQWQTPRTLDFEIWLASGKRTVRYMERPPFLMGKLDKSTMSARMDRLMPRLLRWLSSGDGSVPWLPHVLGSCSKCLDGNREPGPSAENIAW